MCFNLEPTIQCEQKALIYLEVAAGWKLKPASNFVL